MVSSRSAEDADVCAVIDHKIVGRGSPACWMGYGIDPPKWRQFPRREHHPVLLSSSQANPANVIRAGEAITLTGG